MVETKQSGALPPAYSLDTTEWHPKLTRLYHYWIELSRRTDGIIPLRRSFDPTVVPDLLPNIWMLDVQYVPTYRLRYRLLGTRVEHLLGTTYRGCWLDDCHPRIKTFDYTQRFEVISRSGVPSHRRGPPVFWYNKVALLENVVLPFSEIGERVDQFMVQTRFFQANGQEL